MIADQIHEDLADKLNLSDEEDDIEDADAPLGGAAKKKKKKKKSKGGNSTKDRS